MLNLIFFDQLVIEANCTLDKFYQIILGIIPIIPEQGVKL